MVVPLEELLKDREKQRQIKLQQYVSEQVGLPTLNDIMEELAKPGRDPREQFEVFSFTEGVNEIADLKVGMKLPGIVTNITNFGAFVDIGVHQDGLVHTSQLSDQFVANPNDVVKVHQKVEVTVVEVDVARKRISLSMKNGQGERKQRAKASDKQEGKNKAFNKPANAAAKSDQSKSKFPVKGAAKPRKEGNSKPQPEGDLQMKLEALKNKFK